MNSELSSRVHHGTGIGSVVVVGALLSSRVHHGTHVCNSFQGWLYLSSRVHHGTLSGGGGGGAGDLSSRVHHGTLKVSSNILHFFNMLPENINFTPFKNLCFLSSINQWVTNAKK